MRSAFPKPRSTLSLMCVCHVFPACFPHACVRCLCLSMVVTRPLPCLSSSFLDVLNVAQRCKDLEFPGGLQSHLSIIPRSLAFCHFLPFLYFLDVLNVVSRCIDSELPLTHTVSPHHHSPIPCVLFIFLDVLNVVSRCIDSELPLTHTVSPRHHSLP